MILAADNLSGAHPRVARALRELDPRPLQELARQCVAAGARFLDLNPGYLSRREEDRLAFMVEAVQEVTEAGLLLDSPNPRVLARGLAVCRQPPILNAVTLEPEKVEQILPLAREHGTQVVLLLLDEKSHPPPSLEGKLALALELRERAAAAGLSDSRLLFDPVLPNLRWPEAGRHLAGTVQTIRLLASGALFGNPVRTLAGLSNLRSGLRHLYPLHLEQWVLALLAGAGLSMVLANALEPALQEELRFLQGLAAP